MNKGMEQLNTLTARVTALLEAYERLQEENRGLQESVGRYREQVQELETSLRSRDELLANVESRVDGLLSKLAAFAAPESPLLTESRPQPEREGY